MADVTLELKKRADGVAVLTFVRGDGSRTSSPIGAARGFGPVHDLSHYVAESVLGIARGFIGLCGEGWSVADFDKNAAKTIPAEATVAEAVAGEISRMEMTGQWSSIDDFNWTIAASGFAMQPPHYDEIRRSLTRLRAEWDALAPGATLSLPFVPRQPAEPTREGVIA